MPHNHRAKANPVRTGAERARNRELKVQLRELQGGRPMRPKPNSGEPLCVIGEDLANALRPWAAKADAEARETLGSQGGGQRAKNMPVLSAAQRLSAWTGYDESPMRKLLQGNGGAKLVALSRADFILTCAGEFAALADGRVPQYRNPRIAPASYERQMLAMGCDPDEYPLPPEPLQTEEAT